MEKKKINKIPCLVMDLVLRIKHYMLDVISVLLSFCRCVWTVFWSTDIFM